MQIYWCFSCASVQQWKSGLCIQVWQHGSDSAVPVKKWFHFHGVSVILYNSVISQLKCCICKKNNTLSFFFFLVSIKNSACESKRQLDSFFYINLSRIIILASFIYTRADDFYVDRTDKMKCCNLLLLSFFAAAATTVTVKIYLY